jgi:hypothetical protein
MITELVGSYMCPACEKLLRNHGESPGLIGGNACSLRIIPVIRHGPEGDYKAEDADRHSYIRTTSQIHQITELF